MQVSIIFTLTSLIFSSSLTVALPIAQQEVEVTPPALPNAGVDDTVQAQGFGNPGGAPAW
uniref:Uncharacterized protein n=1 Tax=Kwoniella bestiolae CBS 10118 TaxID=1296100 RepID=A0A1B9GEX9_9TREE|nr:hypothetical protein I302_01073 [Kwoniella bestiolae CBS 10118]OCF29565.1 hypothetical protein I302_01073 [Kwoniella bestiolae CBS 10118]